MTKYEYTFYEPRRDYGTTKWDANEITVLGMAGWEAVCQAGGALLMKRVVESDPGPSTQEGEV